MPGVNREGKVDIDGEKGAQISIVGKKIVTQGWSEIMIMKYEQAIHDICFLFSHYYIYIMLYWFDKKDGILFTGYFYF